MFPDSSEARILMERPDHRPVVVILGGGFAGAATAFHLARNGPPGAAEIVVVEPLPTIGPGLAYSTDDPVHRINVPATRMTLVADDPGHFAAWLAKVPVPADATTARGDVYPAREVFGRYVASELAPFLASGAVRHLRCRAAAVSLADGGYRVELSSGEDIAADIVVLAMSHPAPALPRPIRALAGSARLVADPYDNARIAAIGAEERVLVVGTGLTAADVIASLAARGHRGHVVALSRHGLRSRGQDRQRLPSLADFAADPEVTARGLLLRIRAAVAADAAAGRDWHSALGTVRAQGREIWAALPQEERGRIVRHLRRFWDVHRYRVAPQIEAVLDAAIAAGRLEITAARLAAAREDGDGITVAYRLRADGQLRESRFDRVVVTTGPDHGAVLDTNPVLRSFAAAGLVRADPNGLGLLVADLFRAVDDHGRASSSLFVAGPLARGAVGELMGAPEVACHAEEVAEAIRRRVATPSAETRRTGANRAAAHQSSVRR